MNRQEIDQIDNALRQKRALEGFNNGGLSNVPSYIQELERKIETVNYKLNLVLEKLHEISGT